MSRINSEVVNDASKIIEAAARAGATVDIIEPPITGYRTLSPEEIALINQIKQFGIGLGDMVSELAERPGIDKRWLGIAATHLQQGLMAATRSVAQQITF